MTYANMIGYTPLMQVHVMPNRKKGEENQNMYFLVIHRRIIKEDHSSKYPNKYLIIETTNELTFTYCENEEELSQHLVRKYIWNNPTTIEMPEKPVMGRTETIRSYNLEKLNETTMSPHLEREQNEAEYYNVEDIKEDLLEIIRKQNEESKTRRKYYEGMGEYKFRYFIIQEIALGTNLAEKIRNTALAKELTADSGRKYSIYFEGVYLYPSSQMPRIEKEDRIENNVTWEYPSNKTVTLDLLKNNIMMTYTLRDRNSEKVISIGQPESLVNLYLDQDKDNIIKDTKEKILGNIHRKLLATIDKFMKDNDEDD